MRWALVIAAFVVLVPLSAGAATGPGWVTHGPVGGTVNAIEIDPRSPSTIYVGTGTAGVFRSTNGGRTWNRRSNGLPPSTSVGRLELAPSNPSILYFQANASHRLYTTTDAGATWRPLPTIDPSFSDLEVHPTQPRTLYLASFDGLLHSLDGGVTWSEPRGGPYQPDNVAVAPSAPNVIYTDDLGRILRSVDGGASWSIRSSRGATYFEVFAVDPRDPNTVYISSPADGLFKSTDGAATWALIKPEHVGYRIDTFAIDRVNPRRLFVSGQNDGVFRSTDGGSTWTRVTSGLPRQYVRDLEVDPVNGSRAYVALTERGFYRTVSSGRRWAPANRSLVASQVEALAVDPSAPSTAYAGTWGEGLWRTTDGGRHWSSRGLGGLIVNGVAVDPVTPSRMFAAAGNGVYRTANAGRTWKKVFSIANRSVTSVGIVPSARRVVYAGTFEGGTYRSGNGGGTWKRLGLVRYIRVTSFAFHPRRTGTMWIGTGASTPPIYKSTDGGRTWKGASGFKTWGDIRSIVLDPRNARVLYAATTQGGVHKSTDGGLTWAEANNGIGEPTPIGRSIRILAVAIDRRHPRTLFAAGYEEYANGGRVYRSTNGGRSWTDITTGMTTSLTASLAVNPAGTILFAGTRAGGVFTRRVR